MQHRDHVILLKILQEIKFAYNAMCGKDFKEFEKDELLRRAICMTVINIGELVKGLSSEFRLQHTDIPWKHIAGFRDIAAHKYHTLDINAVYNTVILDFPELDKSINKILEIDTEQK